MIFFSSFRFKVGSGVRPGFFFSAEPDPDLWKKMFDPHLWKNEYDTYIICWVQLYLTPVEILFDFVCYKMQTLIIQANYLYPIFHIPVTYLCVFYLHLHETWTAFLNCEVVSRIHCMRTAAANAQHLRL